MREWFRRFSNQQMVCLDTDEFERDIIGFHLGEINNTPSILHSDQEETTFLIHIIWVYFN